MPEIFKLFDGGAVGVERQHASSFSDVSPENDLIARIASGSDSIDLKVDYSDFENFVTFNSAESYVTVTADQILNEYPFGGTVDDLQAFLDSIDGYQQYFLKNWPSRTGHLRLNPAVSSSYVRIDDVGQQDGVSRTSFVSPGTGSISIQGWIDVPAMTGSDDVMVVFQKHRGSVAGGDHEGLFVFVTGSCLAFATRSGTVSNPTVTVSASLTEMPMFFSAVVNRGNVTSSLDLYVSTTGTFPVLAQTVSTVYGSRFDLGSGSFNIGYTSEPLAGKVVRAFTGSLDDISVWDTVRGFSALTSSFNRKVFSQPGLLACWRFNDATQDTPRGPGSIVRDCSGHRLDGRIQSYFSGSRGSGSLAFDSPDPILTLEDPDVIDYVIEAQASGAAYDRDNQTLIWKMFPEAFTRQDPVSADVFKNFALIIARSFDRVKLHISQLVNLRRVNYGEFDQAPDEFLEEVGESLGWDLRGSFVDVDGLRYFLSRDINTGPIGNAGLDTKLSEIKSQFWKRTLLNLLYVYKTKGTRESIESLLRVYGVNNGFVRLKEYACKSEARVPTVRVSTEKSVPALMFGSGSTTTNVQATANIGSNDGFAIELRVKFPLADGIGFVPSVISGTILGAVKSSTEELTVGYVKNSVSSVTGTIFLTSSAGRLELSSGSFCDGDFYNISIVKERATGSVTLSAMKAVDGEIVYSTSSFAFSGTAGYPTDMVYDQVHVGATTGSGEFIAQEFRAWNDMLTESELIAHALHFENYGRDTSYNNRDLTIHWRFAGQGTFDGLGNLVTLDSTTYGNHGSGSNFAAGESLYLKSLESFAYIPSIEYGWNQQKIRSFSGSWIDPYEAYTDENIVSLEFNMYDALNEDISHVMTSYDELNFAIGLPVNKFRPEYERLQQMRETYFKRLQGELRLRTFIDMMDFFDVSFVKIVEKLLPARAIFKGDEMVIESHMLERPKYQYGIRPIREGTLEVSGTMRLVDRDEEWQ